MLSQSLRISVLSTCVVASTSLGAVVTIYPTEDVQVRNNGTFEISTATTARVGVDSNNNSYIAAFALPALPSGEEFVDVTFRLRAKRNTTGQTQPNGDLYGLGFRTSSSIAASDHYGGALDTTDAALIVDSFLLTSSFTNTSSATRTTNAAELSDYLNDQYANSAAQRALGQTIYVFLRVSPDSSATGGSFRFFDLQTVDDATAFNRPFLSFDTAPVPEPNTLGALAALGTLMMRRRR